MKDAKDLIPWQVTDISIRPYDEMWSFNPSLHFDGDVFRCVLRCCDYAMPDGVTIRSKTARPTGQQTKNAMVIFDPKTWKPIQIYKMLEKDNYPRVSTPHVGYEDVRIFRTDKRGLQGIAASLHLRRDGRPTEGAKNQPPEQVLLSFDAEYNIVAAHPIRGDGWSGSPQKNWVPFDECVEPRFLYSIDKGTIYDEDGPVHGDVARVRLSTNSHHARAAMTPLPIDSQPSAPAPTLEPTPAPAPPEPARDHHDQRARPRHPDLRTRIRGGSDVIVRASRSASHSGNASTRIMGTGRTLLPGYEGLRGGTQLVRVGDDAWLGIGHQMRFDKGKKYYWHTWYLVDSRGKMSHTSEPMKFVKNGIEFAAGMGIDGDRVVVSFGVDDMECKIGETQLSAVMGILRPVAR